MNTFDEKQVEDAIHSIDAHPSKKWQKKTRTELRELSAETKTTAQPGILSIFFNLIPMKKGLSVLAALVLVTFVGYSFYGTPVSKANRHLAHARAALVQLQNYAAGGSLTAQEALALVPVAYAQDENAEEGLVAELVEEVQDETEAAVEEAEHVDDAEETVEVLEDIDDVQDETVEVLADVLEVVEDEDVVDTVVEVLEETAELNEEVEETADAVEASIEAGVEDVEIEIATELDEEEPADDGIIDDEAATPEVGEETEGQGNQAGKLERTRTMLGGIDFETTELSPAMQKKYDAIQGILAACEGGEGTCQAGKAKGLATALQAKVRNEARKAEKTKKKGGEDDVVEEEVADVEEEVAEDEEPAEEAVEEEEAAEEEAADETVTEEEAAEVEEEDVAEEEPADLEEDDDTKGNGNAKNDNKGKSEDKGNNGKGKNK